MGKIRVKLLGDESLEQEQKEKAKQRRFAKKAKKEKVRAPGLGGGERVTAVGPTPEEIAEQLEKQPKKKASEKLEKKEAGKTKPTTENRQLKTVSGPKHSKRYIQVLAKVDRSKFYSPTEAFKLLQETASVKFASTIEAHFNLTAKIKAKKKENLSFEKKFPLAHGKLGKTDQSAKDFEKALSEMIKAVGKPNITKLVLSSSMGPGIKVRIK